MNAKSPLYKSGIAKCGRAAARSQINIRSEVRSAHSRRLNLTMVEFLDR
jgi:hypothetical protein